VKRFDKRSERRPGAPPSDGWNRPPASRASSWGRAVAPRPGSRRRGETGRRWPSIGWWASLLFVAGIAAWAITLLVGGPGDGNSSGSDRELSVIVVDANSAQPVQGATVLVGTQQSSTDESGLARLPFPAEPDIVTVRHDAYHSVYGRVDSTMSHEQSVALNPLAQAETIPPAEDSSGTEAGSVGSDGAAGEASTDSAVAAVANDQPGSLAEGDSNADVSSDQSQSEASEAQQEAESDSNPSGEPGIVSGIVTGVNGEPIEDAKVLVGGRIAFTDANGFFEISGAQDGSDLRVWASGYADTFPTVTTGEEMTIALERQDIKAAYLTGARLADEAKIEELIGVIGRTELNALVVDLKEGYVYYDTGVQFFHDANAVQPLFDPAALVQRLKSEGIYTIARIVVFNDPIVAQNRTDLALEDDNGGLWMGWNGAPWVDPFHRELWQPNIDLALEAARFGFDEVQYDYVRFPSDGDLSTANFAGEYSEESRVSTIVEFLEMTQEQLRPTGVKLGADVFAIVAVYPEDQGIGQRLYDFTLVVDYIHPMAYPSHYGEGSIGVDGHPNDFPYETLDITIGLGMAKIPGMELRMRPWIQDFSWGDRAYGPDEVRAQIDATMENGSSGWMHWNADSGVTEGALDPA
jgi:hypothetical protein